MPSLAILDPDYARFTLCSIISEFLLAESELVAYYLIRKEFVTTNNEESAMAAAA